MTTSPDPAVLLAYGADVGAATDLARAWDALVSWRVHRRAGLRVRASGPAAVGSRVDLFLGPRFARMGGTDEVTELIETDGLARLTYRTRPGHAERGEQTFELSTDGGRLRLDVSSRSATDHRLLMAFETAGRLGQQYMAMRYVGSMRRLLVRR
ncbi:hypothetical protein GCM10023169_06190 [Georgenia halophila]|uniref:DUF1990 domain-containing protein n=1 Tax=Georgenia halophila TaxID=620889 RepID=A0ABP8KVJ2_9MICO